MSDKSYSRDCKTCGRAITMGYDSNIQKWRPWDDYGAGISHECSGYGKKLQQEQSMKVNGNNEVLDKLKEITNKQATIIWMLQKMAAKIGIESQSGQS